MSSSTRHEFRLQTILNGLQLIVLLIGVATVFTSIGKRDQQITNTVTNLTELQKIVQELVKAQVAVVTKDGEHDRVLTDLRQRIYRLEEAR